MLCGCRWYFHEQIKIELATKNGSFVHVKDPISFPEFEQLDQFKFTQTERQSNNNSQWKKCVNKALANIGGDKNITNITTISNNSKQEERGRFVFVITDFERRNGNEKDFLQDIDQNLAENGVFFRYVRLKFDDHKQTQITTGGGKSSTINERIRNISSNIIRVAIVEQGSDFDAFVIVRPCPQLNDAEKIREYSYVQHFYYENWLLRNPRGALIGFALCLFAILCAISAYLFNLWEQARTRKKTISQSGQDN